MTGAAIIAYGAASALGLGEEACDVGGPGAPTRSALSRRAGGKPFGRVTACEAERAQRPRALLELGLSQLVAQLDQQRPAWRSQRLGLVIGTSSGGFSALERALTPGAPEPAWSHSAYFAPLSLVAGCLGREPSRLVSLYAACASSTLAIGLGLRWLERDAFDLVIVGGYDAESDWVCAGFDALKATSSEAPRPFRAERDGMALGEGVALLALSHRAEKPLGFVRGFGATTDAVHITAPDRTGSGLARAAGLALLDAKSSPSAIDFVSVHGTGTSFNDAAEAQALRLVFADRAERVPLQAVKAAIGHTLGAAGALEALFALSAMRRGVLPACSGAGTPMPELAARLLDHNVAAPSAQCLKLSTAFGGANAALVLSTEEPADATRAARPVVRMIAVGSSCSELEPSRVAEFLVAPPERLPRSDTLSSLAVAAAAEALRDARARGVSFDPLRTGVIVGSVGATLEADAEFGVRLLDRGPQAAEPRRFPATSPNACAGHVAIAFGWGGPSHAVGAGADAALEAVEVACDWLAAGDADVIVVVAAEQGGATARRALEAIGVVPPEQGALAAILAVSASGPELTPGLLERVRLTGRERPAEMSGFRALAELCSAAGLPSSVGFGTVRAPE